MRERSRTGCGSVERYILNGKGSVQREAEQMAAEGGTVLITGANRGLGLEMVRQLVECDKPAKRVFACCRDPKGAPAEVRVFTSGVVSELLNKRKVQNCKVPETDRSEIEMTAPAIKIIHGGWGSLLPLVVSVFTGLENSGKEAS